MIEINGRIRIPDSELEWSFVRSSGPGGQNVNKVASKAVLRWDLAGSPSVSEDVKARLRAHERKRITNEGVLIVSSQRFRDQDGSGEDCMEKRRALVRQAATPPRPRRPTRPTQASRRKRMEEKRRRAAVKVGRRTPGEE